MHGSAAAAREIGNVSESSVSPSKALVLKQNEDSEGIISLLTKKCGHTLLLGSDLDEKLQIYLRKIRTNGGPPPTNS